MNIFPSDRQLQLEADLSEVRIQHPKELKASGTLGIVLDSLQMPFQTGKNRAYSRQAGVGPTISS